jgi:hypothetical protein
MVCNASQKTLEIDANKCGGSVPAFENYEFPLPHPVEMQVPLAERLRLTQHLSVKAKPLSVRIQGIKIGKILCKTWGNERAAAPSTLKV